MLTFKKEDIFISEIFSTSIHHSIIQLKDLRNIFTTIYENFEEFSFFFV